MNRIVLIIASLLACQMARAADVSWYKESFRIQAGGQLLDTERGGHAAPALADVDGDGQRDLIVGTFSGKFRYYRNIGTDNAPLFDKEYTWLMAGGSEAQVPIYCCVAASPVVIDLDKDGMVDLVSGSFDPGAIYWFKGRGNGQFETRQMLTDLNGLPVLADIGSVHTDMIKSKCSIPSVVDWNHDGLLDIVFGTSRGQILLSKGTQTETPGVAYTPLPSQPVFSVNNEALGLKGRRRFLPPDEKHASPVVADWDGDGLPDLLIGSYSGTVYFVRNTGTTVEPQFESREVLLPAGIGANQWALQGHAPKRGIRSQIQVVDYNRDGKLDLLLGDWANTIAPRSDLTKAEKAKLDRLAATLARIDAEVDYDFILPRSYDKKYEQNKIFSERAASVEKEMQPYLVTRKSGFHVTSTQNHGYVWVFLR